MSPSDETSKDRAGLGALALGLAVLALAAAALGAGTTCPGRRAERTARAAGPGPAKALVATRPPPMRVPLAPAESERAAVAPGEDDGTPRGVLATVVARVVTPEGTPVERASLLLRHGDRLVERHELEGPEPVRFAGLEPGRYSLELDAATLPAGLLPRLDATSGTPRVPFVLAGGRTTECALLAIRGARPRGLVLDPDGAPVAGARLRLQGLDPALEPATPEAVSGEDGSFAFEDVLPGRYRALLEWPEGVRGAAPPPFRLELAADAEPWLEMRGEGRPRTIVGRLLDEEGRPLAGQIVQCEWIETEEASPELPASERARAPAREPPAAWSCVVARTRSAADGAYRLEGLPRGTVRIRAAPRLGQPGFGTQRDACEEFAGPALDLAVGADTLDLGATILHRRRERDR